MSTGGNPWGDELLNHRSALEDIRAARMRIEDYRQRLDHLEAAVEQSLKRRYQQRAKRNDPPPQRVASSTDSSQ